MLATTSRKLLVAFRLDYNIEAIAFTTLYKIYFELSVNKFIYIIVCKQLLQFLPPTPWPQAAFQSIYADLPLDGSTDQVGYVVVGC